MIPPAVCIVYTLRFCVSSQEMKQTESLVYDVCSSLSRTWGLVGLQKGNHKEIIKR